MKYAALLAVLCSAVVSSAIDDPRYLRPRCRRRKRHVVRHPVTRSGANRHGQRRSGRRPAMRSASWPQSRRRGSQDRRARHVALARRSHGRHGRARQPYPDSPLPRSRGERSTGGSRRCVPFRAYIIGLVAKSKAYGGEGRATSCHSKGVDWRFVTSARETISKALPGAGRPNPPSVAALCAFCFGRARPAATDSER